ncbi:P-loop NTPase [Halosimplex pelagicum]|uniref:Iron-sulfur cluster carrier protein n=1 Tax=Halosimplex pelagicum TaxID=869886 RepID=A0A7D5TG87_9EURY|nr:P-loop NTPase [Halosimplex pelagicum]
MDDADGTERTNTDETTDDLQEEVEAALRQVRDPDAGKDVFEAGLVSDIAVSEGAVTVVADLTDFRPQEGEQVTSAMLRAVSEVPGVEHAHIERETGASADEDRSTGLADVDRVIAVASAKGGVGKTTVATHIACAMAGADRDVGLFDADIHGPNVPEVLEVSGPVYSDDDGNPLPVEAGELDVMSVGLMESGAPLAWRGAMAHDALSELFEDTAWGDLDTLVVDLPPGTGDVVLTTLQEVHLDGVVFVTTPFHAAVTDTARSLDLFEENDVPVLGVAVNMAGFTCPSCGDEHDLFEHGEPLDGLDAPVLAELEFDPSVQATPRPGELPEQMQRLGEDARERCEDVWAVDAPDDAVDLRGVDADGRHDRVREGFDATERGEAFVLVSDRDPAPVRSFIASLSAEADGPGDLDPFEVERLNPETWVLRTVRP